MSEKKGLFGLFGKKEEEEKNQTQTRAAGSASKAELDKAKAEMLQKQEERQKATKEVKKHVVVSGDTLSGIAKKYYDDAGKYLKIYEANQELIGDNPDLIKPGMELVIPNL